MVNYVNYTVDHEVDGVEGWRRGTTTSSQSVALDQVAELVRVLTSELRVGIRNSARIVIDIDEENRGRREKRSYPW